MSSSSLLSVFFVRFILRYVSLQRSPQDMNSHDQLVLALLESGFGKLLVEISETSAERDFHLWILEIFAMLLKQHVNLLNYQFSLKLLTLLQKARDSGSKRCRRIWKYSRY